MYAWALLGQPRRVQSYFGRLERRAKGSAVAAMPGGSEVAWGILLYAHARAHDIHGTLSVLARAREMVTRSSSDAIASCNESGSAKISGRTSYLVNISVCALLVDRDSRSALSLLDACISRYDDFMTMDDAHAGGRRELPATPADPVTRSLIIRALLDNQRLAQAVEVHNSVHAQYNLPEYASELKPMLKFCLGQGDVSSALLIATRILQIGGASALTDSQWIRLLRLCIEERKDSAVAELLTELGALDSEHSEFAVVVAPVLRSKLPEAIEWISGVLKERSRGDEAGTRILLEDVDGSLSSSAGPVLPELPAQCLSLYRGLLRVIRAFPLVEMRGKLKYNARFCYELYRDLEPHDPKIQELVDSGKQQLQWLSAWKDDPETCQKLYHKPAPKK
ncbi:hypothetical protein GGI21_003108 [Coemansia aciculifera]|nr:hypothetical protein GGI21_003108 [Coemansia aciculifera]